MRRSEGQGRDHRYLIAHRYITAAAAPLYHGTSHDFSEVRPSREHGNEVFEGLSSPEHAYATADPHQAKTYAEISQMMHGGRARVYEVGHRGRPDELEHDPGYDADVRSPAGFRVVREVPGSELTRMPRHAAQQGPRCPCGWSVEFDPQDGWQHADGSISHEGDLARYSVSDLMDLGRLPKRGRYTAPTQRLFGPTYGLDTRLFDGDKLKPSVRASVIRQFTAFCERHGYQEWPRWAKIVFFGSEASEWTSPDGRGNNDFDLSIGLFYFMFRLHYHPDLYTSDEDIAARFTREMHAELNDPQHRFPGVEGVYDQTWFANLKGWDIAEIRPYAAYDVVEDEWIVKPPHLETWSMKDFPEGKGLAEEVKGVILAAQGILAMPEPYRTQNGAAFWEFVHSNRSDAFGPRGEGWWDARNVIEKALDQKGLMQQLFECHRRAAEDPSSLLSPVDWSNTPVVAG